MEYSTVPFPVSFLSDMFVGRIQFLPSSKFWDACICDEPGTRLNIKTVFPSVGIPMLR